MVAWLLGYIKRTGFPKFFAQELFERIAQQFHQEWVDVGDFPCPGIQDEDPILGLFQIAAGSATRLLSAHQPGFSPTSFFAFCIVPTSRDTLHLLWDNFNNKCNVNLSND